MATELDDDQRFSNEEVSSIVHECVDNAIGENSFSNEMASIWSSTIASACIANLNKLNKPYKYTMTCSIMQKNGAGVHSASSCYWDNSNDAVCSVQWENDTIRCIVNVFGFAL
ncbi:dynein light chain Tctex-type 1-like [Frankliniella occidentalis]|uniref:Dynein light chain Tctex-type 1-like n=1 Tax=Frankliniella occidentalis TaxID=133901 RepID=A0A6J1RZB4_FRAOC|nr:dynein light chain Tctex-type 1-like [Frankliniella occidentalis]